MNFEALIEVAAQVAPAAVIGFIALPSFVALLRQKGVLPGVFIAMVLGLYALVAELIAVQLGSIFGGFSYDGGLGYKVLGLVPWTIMLAYPPMILASFWLGSKFTLTFGRVFLSTLFMVLFAAALGPIMALLELWQWDTEASVLVLSGVPIMHFVGWFVGGFMGSLLLYLLWGKENFVLRGVAYSGLLFSAFLLGINLGIGNLLPALISTVVMVVILIFAGYEKLKNSHARE